LISEADLKALEMPLSAPIHAEIGTPGSAKSKIEEVLALLHAIMLRLPLMEAHH
jgi:hypothetical protein